jgi:hypothetical protein
MPCHAVWYVRHPATIIHVTAAGSYLVQFEDGFEEEAPPSCVRGFGGAADDEKKVTIARDHST